MFIALLHVIESLTFSIDVNISPLACILSNVAILLTSKSSNVMLLNVPLLFTLMSYDSNVSVIILFMDIS